MKEGLLSKRIPTILGLFLIIGGIISTTLLVQRGTLFETKAGPGQIPKNVEVTNITDGSFTVTYTTDDNVIGTITYGVSQEALDRVVLDDRDQLTQAVERHTVHSITAKDLNPNTSYYFSITSGDETYLNEGSLYLVTTGSVIETDPPSQNPLSGSVLLPSGSPAKEGLVYVKIDGAQSVSTLLKEDGTYIIPLNSLRNATLDQYFSIDPNSILNIDVKSSNMGSTISVSPNQINPVPVITLSNNYDFSTQGTPTPSDEPSEAFPTIQTSQTQTPTTTTPIQTPVPTSTPTPTEVAALVTETPSVEPTITQAMQTPQAGSSSGIIASVTALLTAGAGAAFLLTKGRIS